MGQLTFKDESNTEIHDDLLERVLSLIEQRRGLNFRIYRRATIERRILGRMRLARTNDLETYISRLASQPEEIDHLIAHLTIKVSEFFRNKPVYELLREIVLPDLTTHHPQQPLLVWSAGCANGEEAYSLAMLQAELERKTGLSGSIVYASDVDHAALTTAAEGVYRQEAVADIPAELRAEHFISEPYRQGQRYRASAELRARVRFLQHNLCGTDSGPEKQAFDLICCRNVQIYFNQPTQKRVQALLYNSLCPGGYLCLGEAEHLAAELESEFQTINRKARLYKLKAADHIR